MDFSFVIFFSNYYFASFRINFALVVTVVTIGSRVVADEVRLTCMEEGNAEPAYACALVENVNVSAGDTVAITNANQFVNSTELSAKESNWEVIPSIIFSAFPHMHRIEMSVGLKRLPAETFLNAGSLNTIQLSGNHIAEIPRKAFAGAENVRIINLVANKIANIENGAFDEFQFLTHLFLTRNELRIVRNGTFAGALKLKRIELDRNQIETVEPDAFDLPGLEYVDLGHNRLKALTADVFNGAPILKTLILNNNELGHVNELIAKLSLKRLSTFVLANNPIESVNLANALSLPKLVSLNVRNTTVNVYAEVTNGTSTDDAVLEAIDLSANNLTRSDILSVLTIFPNLAEINLEMNAFAKIDGLNRVQETFMELQTLNIGCNRFECTWLTQALQTVHVTLDTLSCPEPAIFGTKNVRNVDCV